MNLDEYIWLDGNKSFQWLELRKVTNELIGEEKQE